VPVKRGRLCGIALGIGHVRLNSGCVGFH